VARALELARLHRENRHLRARLADRPDGSSLPSDVIAHSAAMLAALDLAKRAARGRSSVLITGESGTGKEVVARLVHYHSDRVDQPFVAVNCKAFAEGVLESELFGHVKGAFTGASRAKPGLFRRADGGTLFLDEIGETAPDFQAKLLRVLQERRVRPVGGDAEVPVDVRIVAATNRDLGTEVSEGRFREDLFFRLCVIPVPLEPLRNRREDVLPLARHFLARWSREIGAALTGWSDEVERHLLEHPWPGNVRELENAIERGVVLAKGEQLELADLALATGLEPKAVSDPGSAPEVPADAPLQHALDLATSHHVERALAVADGKKSEAARTLGIDRTTLYRLIRRLGVET
jgi:DNA-binding NtrC family response regulator